MHILKYKTEHPLYNTAFFRPILSWLLVFFIFNGAWASALSCGYLFQKDVLPQDSLFFQPYEARLKQIQALEVKQGRELLSRLRQERTIFFDEVSFKSRPVEKIATRGIINAGIYLFKDSYYGDSVLKLYPISKEVMDSLAEESMDVSPFSSRYLEQNPLEKSLFERRFPQMKQILYGNFLAEQVGGPKVIDIGFLRNHQGEMYLYIQMVSVFTGQESVSLKRSALRPSSREYANRLLGKNKFFAAQLASRLVSVLEQQVSIEGADLLVTKDGEFKLIGADFWKTTVRAEELLGPIRDLVYMIQELSPAMASALRIQIIKKAVHSKKISIETKNQLVGILSD